jgi:biopolymer transport protein ExbB/TolQ
MEITSFVLGMLTIVAVIIIAVIVVGIVKITQLKAKTKSLEELCAAIERDLRHELDNVYNNMERREEEIRRIIEDTNRDITMVERTLSNQINETRKYIDSRIDKTLTTSKQILKG